MDWLKDLLKKLGVADTEVDKIVAEVSKELPKHTVPKDQYNTAVDAKKKAEKDLTERDGQLEELKKSAGDNQALKDQITKLQGDNKTAKDKYDADIKELQLNTAIKLAVTGDAHDPDLIAGMIDKSKLILGDDGKVTGLDEQVKGLRTSKAFLFADSKNPKFKGTKPPEGGGGGGGTEHPDLAKLKADQVEAIKNRNMPLQISLKNQIFELEQQSKG